MVGRSKSPIKKNGYIGVRFDQLYLLGRTTCVLSIGVGLGRSLYRCGLSHSKSPIKKNDYIVVEFVILDESGRVYRADIDRIEDNIGINCAVPNNKYFIKNFRCELCNNTGAD